mgnify:CR=1 FL=1
MKIVLASKKRDQSINEQGCVKLDKEARGMVVVLMQQTGNDAKYIVSEIIKQAVNSGMLEVEE